MYVKHTCEKVKQSLYRPGQALRVAGVHDTRHKKVKSFLTLGAGHLYHLPPQKIFLVLIFVIG
jgi:hypothetical protein